MYVNCICPCTPMSRVKYYLYGELTRRQSRMPSASTPLSSLSNITPVVRLYRYFTRCEAEPWPESLPAPHPKTNGFSRFEHTYAEAFPEARSATRSSFPHCNYGFTGIPLRLYFYFTGIKKTLKSSNSSLSRHPAYCLLVAGQTPPHTTHTHPCPLYSVHISHPSPVPELRGSKGVRTDTTFNV